MRVEIFFLMLLLSDAISDNNWEESSEKIFRVLVLFVSLKLASLSVGIVISMSISSNGSVPVFSIKKLIGKYVLFIPIGFTVEAIGSMTSFFNFVMEMFLNNDLGEVLRLSIVYIAYAPYKETF